MSVTYRPILLPAANVTAPVPLVTCLPTDHEDVYLAVTVDGPGLLTEASFDLLGRVPPGSGQITAANIDRHGRLWTVSRHDGTVSGTLRRWDADGGSVLATGGFTNPVGIAWSPDDLAVYLLDSATGVLHRADFYRDEGVVGQFWELATFERGRHLIGLTVSIDGTIWVADAASAAVTSITPGGDILQTALRAPAPGVGTHRYRISRSDD